MLPTYAQLTSSNRGAPCIEFPGQYIVYYQGRVDSRTLYLGDAHKEALKALQESDTDPEVNGDGVFIAQPLRLTICWEASSNDPRLGQVWFSRSYQLGHYNLFGDWVEAKVVVKSADCSPVGDVVYGNWSAEIECPDVLSAQRLGESLLAKGKCVIVRPTYNEEDSRGQFFREWRSFNGEPFYECRWNLPLWLPARLRNKSISL